MRKSRGEVWERGDVKGARQRYVVISNDMYHDAGSDVLVCPIVETDENFHVAGAIRIASVLAGYVLPSRITWLPQSALLTQVGALTADEIDRTYTFLCAALGP